MVFIEVTKMIKTAKCRELGCVYRWNITVPGSLQYRPLLMNGNPSKDSWVKVTSIGNMGVKFFINREYTFDGSEFSN